MTIESTAAAPVALGFLTVIEQPAQGLVGGYLIVNAHARPLEFHCTAPVRANRAQEVLYGSTLEPYLYGEQIGATLIKAARLQPLAVFTDCQPALAAADHILAPVWWVMPRQADASAQQPTIAHSDEHPAPPPARAALPVLNDGATIRLGENTLVPARTSRLASPATIENLSEQLPEFAAKIDLLEPFERLRAAIQESQRGWR